MKNRKYESPEITVISLEPDASLMDNPGGGALPGIGNTGLGGVASNQPPEPSNNELPTAL